MMWVWLWFWKCTSAVPRHIHVLHVLTPHPPKNKKEPSNFATIRPIYYKVYCVHRIFHQISFVCKLWQSTQIWQQKWILYIQNHGENGITLDCSCKISRHMTFSCSGGGHIGLFATRPPGDTSTCLRCFFGNLIPTSITMPYFTDLSPSARFYELLPCYLSSKRISKV